MMFWPFKKREPSRYFMVVFSFRNNECGGGGNLSEFGPGHPQLERAKRIAAEHISSQKGRDIEPGDVVITAIHEFKTKEDFEEFYDEDVMG